MIDSYDSKVARGGPFLGAKVLMAQQDPQGHVVWPKDLTG